MSARVKMLVLDDHEGKIAAAPGAAAMREIADVTVLRQPLSEVADEDLADVQIVMALRERTRFDAATFDRLPQLELLLQTGGHAYHVDAAAAAQRGVLVTLGRRAGGPRAAVPELVFALAIAALRQFPEAQRTMQAGQWAPLVGRTLHGRRLGMLGMGRHGKSVARLGEAFGMTVAPGTAPGRGRRSRWPAARSRGSRSTICSPPRTCSRCSCGCRRRPGVCSTGSGWRA